MSPAGLLLYITIIPRSLFLLIVARLGQAIPFLGGSGGRRNQVALCLFRKDFLMLGLQVMIKGLRCYGSTGVRMRKPVAFTIDVYSHIIEGMQSDAIALLDEVLPAGIKKKSVAFLSPTFENLAPK